MSQLHVDGGTVRTRFAWDALRLLMALASVVIITFELAFVHHPRLGTSLLIYAIDAAFLFDIWSRRRSTNDEDSIGWVNPSRVYSTSLSAYALLLLGNLPIDLLFFIGDGELWGISLVLWVRLLRFIRVGEVFAALRRLERVGWSNTAALRIVRLIVLAGLVVHLLACLWYLIPFVQEFPANSWPVVEEVVGASPGYSYLLSLYWVVVVGTSVGFGDIVPGNTEEYVFAIITMIVGFSVFAYVVATGAALISSLNLSRAAFISRLDTVESYLHSRRVDPSITEDVRRYYEYLWDQHGGFQQGTLLSDLPPPLRLSVLSDLLSELLPNVPVFRHSSPALRRELMLSLEPVVTQPGGYLVSDGDAADGIYFIARGTLEVVSADGDTVHGTLSAGDYFGDLTLLLGENRSASVRSAGFSEVFRLDAEAYQRIRAAYPDLREVLMKSSQERSSTVNQLVLDGIVL